MARIRHLAARPSASLAATYARFEKTDGTPVTGKAVTIIVNDLDEIEDIITEDI